MIETQIIELHIIDMHRIDMHSMHLMLIMHEQKCTKVKMHRILGHCPPYTKTV